MAFSQEQRKNYKHGFLSAEQIKQLETIPGWLWETPEHIKFTAYRFYADNGETKPFDILKVKPYGLPGYYRLTLENEGDPRYSMIIITKNNKVVTSFEAMNKCAHAGCNCNVFTNRVVVQ